MTADEKKDALKLFIKECVKTEVRKYLSVRLPIILKEVVDLKLDEISETTSTKAKKINESVDVDDKEYRSIGTFNSSNLSKLLDMSETVKAGSSLGREFNNSYKTTTEAGMEIEIPLNKMPDHLKKALTRDYRDVMNKMTVGRNMNGNS